MDDSYYQYGFVVRFNDSHNTCIVRAFGGLEPARYSYLPFRNFHAKITRENRVLYSFENLLKVNDCVKMIVIDQGKDMICGIYKVRYHVIAGWTDIPVPYLEKPYRLNYLPQITKYKCTSNFNIVGDVKYSELEKLDIKVYWSSSNNALGQGNGKKILIKPESLFFHGHKLPAEENFMIACADASFHAVIKPIHPVEIHMVDTVAYECVLGYHGCQPKFDYIYRPSKPLLKTPLLTKDMNIVPLSKYDSRNKIEKYSENDSIEAQISRCMSKKLVTPIFGKLIDVNNGFIVFGNGSLNAFCKTANFYIDGTTSYSSKDLTLHLKKYETMIFSYGYASVRTPPQLSKYKVTHEVIHAWIGINFPREVKKFLHSLHNFEIDSKESIYEREYLDVSEDYLINRIDLTDIPATIPSTQIRMGRLSASVLYCTSSSAIISGYSNAVLISKENFYVNGVQFKGGSLAQYFLKLNHKVNTFFVPFVDVLDGVTCYSKALCAWIGSEPKILKSIMHNCCPPKSSSLDIKIKNRLFYCSASVAQLGDHYGILRCNVNNMDFRASFSLNELYVNGTKVDHKSSLIMYSKILIASRWSVLVSYNATTEVPGVNHRAVIVWHNDNQLDLLDEFTHKIPLWVKKLNAEKCACYNRFSDKDFSCKQNMIMYGNITESNSQQLAVGLRNRGVLWVDKKLVWVDGCVCYVSKADTNRFCYICFDSQKKLPLYGWIGLHPSLVYSDSSVHTETDSYEIDDEDECTEEYDEDENDEEDENGEEEEESDDADDSDESSESEEDIDPTQVSDPYEYLQIVEKNSFEQKSKKKSKTPKHESIKFKQFGGFFTTGIFKDVVDDIGIICWKEPTTRGIVYAQVLTKYIYIGGRSFIRGGFKHQKNMWFGKNCSLYVNTLPEAKYMGTIEISSEASVAWIGQKPGFVPQSGHQDAASYEESHLRIAFSGNNGLMFVSLNFYRSQQNNNEGIESISQGTGKLSVSSNTSTASYYSATSSPGRTTPNHRITPIPTPRTSTILGTTPNSGAIQNSGVQPSSRALSTSTSASQLTNTATAMTNSDVTIWTGKIVELHADLCKLVGEDGCCFYVSSDVMYLHGVPLHHIEIPNVLIQGE